MKENSVKNTVLVKRCEEYDQHIIEEIVSNAMHQLNYKPTGKVFVKPNAVFANNPEVYGTHAYTHPAVIGASLTALSKTTGVERIDLGENAAVGMPTRMVYKYAGYYDEIKRVRKRASCPVGIFCIDEERRDSVFLGGQVHDNLRIARKMARADTMVYLPKLKCHCVSNMTGTVKLNIGICSDDERSIRHDFMLNEKIVDLLSVGWPDFTVMDAVEVGVGNEALPTARKLGLILMGRNPIAVDLVAARLLGYDRDDVPYLRTAVNRGYTPTCLEEVTLAGDLTSIEAIDEQAKRIMPYDDEYFRWQDVNRELKRMNSPIRFLWGPYKEESGDRCLTGCVMGLKMFLAFIEQYTGPQAFARALPVVFVIGRWDKEVDARGENVFLLGSCARAKIVNAKKIIHLDKCFTTVSVLMHTNRYKLCMTSPSLDPCFVLTYLGAVSKGFLKKWMNLRYPQDIGHFVTKKQLQRV